MELVEPEHQVGHKKVANFIAAVVEDQRAPFLVLADAWIGVLIQMAAIKKGQTVTVTGEVTWHPVDDHADALGVASIDKTPEFIRGSVAAGRGIPASDLITPGAIKWMLGDRHQFDVREAPLLDVGNEPISQFRIGEQASTWFEICCGNRWPGAAIGFNERLFRRGVNPAAKVHLIHRDRLIQHIAAVARLHPAAVRPVETIEMAHQGACVWTHFVLEAVGIGLLVAVAVLGSDFVFVELSFS